MIRPEPNELAELVQDLHRRGTPWLPAGQGSRLHWGPPVRQPCAVLSCGRLNRILEHNPGDFTIRVEAGTPLDEVQAALARHGQWLSLDPPWGGEGNPLQPGAAGSIGGLVARGLAGGYRQRYLGVRDQLIGIHLLRADGVAARAGGKVVKNVAGYDLMRLFTGSWGSLGLITEVTLRTMPLPPCRRGLLVQGPMPDLAELSRRLLGSSLSPERIDWWSGARATAAGFEPRPLLLIGLASVDADALDEQIAFLGSDPALAARVLDADALAALLASPGAPAQPAWLLRLGASPDRVPELLQAPELRDMAVDLSAGSGLGLAWSAAPLPSGAVVRLRQECRRLGGHLTVLVQPAGAHLPAWEDAPSRALIEALKRCFDPKLQLAPGRLPGIAAPQPAGSASTS